MRVLNILSTLRIKKILFFLIFNTYSFIYLAQSCQTPFTPCWCDQHPGACDGNPNDPIPINNELWILIVVGLILGIYYIKKYKSSSLKKVD